MLSSEKVTQSAVLLKTECTYAVSNKKIVTEKSLASANVEASSSMVSSSSMVLKMNKWCVLHEIRQSIDKNADLIWQKVSVCIKLDEFLKLLGGNSSQAAHDDMCQLVKIDCLTEKPLSKSGKNNNSHLEAPTKADSHPVVAASVAASVSASEKQVEVPLMVSGNDLENPLEAVGGEKKTSRTVFDGACYDDETREENTICSQKDDAHSSKNQGKPYGLDKLVAKWSDIFKKQSETSGKLRGFGEELIVEYAELSAYLKEQILQ